ncbi:hypothetical protein [Pseudomonas eucalypticola]
MKIDNMINPKRCNTRTPATVAPPCHVFFTAPQISSNDVARPRVISNNESITIVDRNLAMKELPMQPVLLEKLYENQLAIAAAVEELTLWVEVRWEAEDIAENVRSALETLDRNADFINRTINELRKDRTDL